ncbi:RNA-directed DNA polymerase (reverse transcriptase)-related family protein [Rhynchospora pubera]|uniref:RNA-directed DNA polymerase (Reverse transcriptase)-related family protein n=1 Tax=Rhynchospora pubera TaxID=906938 RepID=A0AAV8CWN6_9POAL|nr:RNA-directed DNA polymerase (reverse transcriptase)-related family protein [Rhynchospora pubera]
MVSEPAEVKEALYTHFYSSLGIEAPCPPPFNLTGKVGAQLNLDSIASPFTEQEVLKAINELPSGKSSGPDGFPIDFFKRFWEVIGPDIMVSLDAFQQGKLNLRSLNKATITLVPKKALPLLPNDFRPISVINTLPKLITKILANRLQSFMPELISPLQTAFTKGRSVMESFMIAREYLSFYHKRKIPALMYKVDFAKAFDTISWTFLTNLLAERGFPPLWIAWLLDILKSSSSAIKVNGEVTNFFFHRRGLRQGDPLSPMLFNLVVDALQSFLQNASSLTSGPIIIPPRTLQYADDTIILLEAFPRNLIIVKEILLYFALLTGLHINDDKCLFVPVAIPDSSLLRFSRILNCSPKDMPVTYLGLPLSIRRLKKVHYKPLIDAFQRKLDGWKSRFLSSAGRLTLINSVLTSLPLYYMQVMQLPAWLITHLDGIRRRFFWKGRDKCLGGHCLVNWNKCCIPKCFGGLGILNLTLQNQALLIRWLWKLNSEPNSTWTTTVQALYGTTDLSLLLNTNFLSHGLRDILKFLPFYSTSIDSTRGSHVLSWRWTNSGCYTSASAYALLANPGIRSPYFGKLWKLKAPPKVKIFLWLLLQDRLLTQQNLLVRNWPANDGCPCCLARPFETACHLFLHCPFATALWNRIRHFYLLPPLILTDDLPEFWLRNSLVIGTVWDIIWAATSWTIWKERNSRIFNSLTRPQFLLVQEISTLVELWKKLA